MRKSGFAGVVAILLELSLSACAGMSRYDAAGDIHAFLIAIRDGDQAAFDAHVDRPALKAQIKARFLAGAAKAHGGWGALGAALVRPLVDLAADQLIQPDVFRAVAEYLGYSARTPIPDRVVIASGLKVLDHERVCVTRSKGGPCVLVFKDEDGVWRLTGFEGDPSMLRPPGKS